ncbi:MULTISPECIES: ABC transporter permease [unclassified Cyanobium]|uniref:PhnE/PtxC family ABC transporter permease n=1 Tax=unclassified Cyanobium TaxID=2627006 RepID=UPI0020CC10C5|nr:MULTISPECIES: phosphonate ABC transporter [unclassified Cyanobium]MCP9859224.1 phosphonate ABC transporter [Cyanobium sp. Cruz-8H5]MCP9866383.1 phosphonate ABC transporter [Cyanobium sp. Cruz-8D1]
MKPASPLLMLLPALVLVPLAVLLPPLVHGGGWELIGSFVLAAVTPSLDPVVLASLLKGLGVTAGMALLGWAGSLVLGLVLGAASSRTVWRTLTGSGVPAELIRCLLALPRAIHELIWGLLLLQLVGLQPAVAVLAIALPFGALVARVLSDLLDALPTANLEALRAAGAPAPAALLTALGPALLPGVLSYGGYRLECALRSATLLGVFGLGGLGTDLKLTLQSLEFHELWSGLWLLLAVMLALEAVISLLRRRWLVPGRFVLARRGVGERSREMLLTLAALLPLCVLVGRGLGVDPAALLHWQPLPGLGGGSWVATFALPWPRLVGGTLLLTGLAASLAVGLAPLLLLVVAPVGWARQGLRLLWALGRLWPPPLTALLLLFVLEPGVITAALALGFHNLGVLGRLLLESADSTDPAAEEALACGGSGPRLALLYGRFSGLARPYLAYGAYRADVILRESVVVGLVGATGLGSQLLESLSSFAWDQLLALVAVYALLTLVGEDLSDRARRRWLAAA